MRGDDAERLWKDTPLIPLQQNQQRSGGGRDLTLDSSHCQAYPSLYLQTSLLEATQPFRHGAHSLPSTAPPLSPTGPWSSMQLPYLAQRGHHLPTLSLSDLSVPDRRFMPTANACPAHNFLVLCPAPRGQSCGLNHFVQKLGSHPSPNTFAGP